jgi:uncharacterized protein YcfL
MHSTGGPLPNNPYRTAALNAGGLVVSALLLAACGTNTYATSAPKSNIDIVQRVQRDPGLASDVVIEGARIDDKAGNKVGQVTLRNVGQSDRMLQYRFEWFDQAGSRVSPSSTPWRTATLGAGEMKELVSPGGPQGFDFRMSIKSS